MTRAAIRIVFMGTPDFAVPILQALLQGPDEVVGIVTQPDRPSGRGLATGPPPVKKVAQERGLPILQPGKIKDRETVGQIAAWQPDLIIVAAYGKILPGDILSLPSFGCINVHASLLPKYRGAAPIPWTILRGETVTGVTVMQMNERMDAGDILCQKTIAVAPDETAATLYQKLSTVGAEAMGETLHRLKHGTLTPTPQREAEATYAPAITKADGRIDWSREAAHIERMTRAFDPWPSAYTTWEGKLLKIFRAKVICATDSRSRPPGTVVKASPQELLVATGKDYLSLQEVQLEGRKRLAIREFCQGVSVTTGQILGH